MQDKCEVFENNVTMYNVASTVAGSMNRIAEFVLNDFFHSPPQFAVLMKI